MESCFKQLLMFSLLAFAVACGQDGKAPILTPRSGCNPCKVFVTNSGDDGLMGGITGADQRCMTDGNFPGSGTYKALIVDGINRRACSSASCASSSWREGIDWTLYPNTSYTRVGGTAIGTTTSAGIFSFPLTASFVAGNHNSYTGLKSDWTTGQHCNSWNANGAETADVADAGLTTSGAISNQSGVQCVSNLYLICVEQ